MLCLKSLEVNYLETFELWRICFGISDLWWFLEALILQPTSSTLTLPYFASCCCNRHPEYEHLEGKQCISGYSPSLREAKGGTQARDLEPGTETDHGRTLMTSLFFLWARFLFFWAPHPFSRDGTINNRLCPLTSNLNLKKKKAA